MTTLLTVTHYLAVLNETAKFVNNNFITPDIENYSNFKIL